MAFGSVLEKSLIISNGEAHELFNKGSLQLKKEASIDMKDEPVTIIAGLWNGEAVANSSAPTGNLDRPGEKQIVISRIVTD